MEKHPSPIAALAAKPASLRRSRCIYGIIHLPDLPPYHFDPAHHHNTQILFDF